MPEFCSVVLLSLSPYNSPKHSSKTIAATDELSFIWKMAMKIVSCALKPGQTLQVSDWLAVMLKGSLSWTSNAAALIRPSFSATANACSSTRPPRAVFTRNAPTRNDHHSASFITNTNRTSYAFISGCWVTLGWVDYWKKATGEFSVHFWNCMEYEVEGSRPRRRPKRTWRQVVQKDCQTCKLNKDDVSDCWCPRMCRLCTLCITQYGKFYVRQCINQTRMWANAQPDGRPAKHRWRLLFNATKFGWRPY